MISGSYGLSPAASQWQVMEQSQEAQQGAGSSARATGVQPQTTQTGIPIRYKQTVSDICSHIVGAINRVDTLDAETANAMVVPAYMDASERADLMRVVEASLSLELPHARFPIGERLTARALLSLRQERVRARLHPDVTWLADGLAEIGERKLAALRAADDARTLEDAGWVNYGEDLFGPEVEDAFSAPELDGLDLPDRRSLGEILPMWLADLGFVVVSALQRFRWAGSGVDASRGVDYERVARIGQSQHVPSGPTGVPPIPLLAGSSAPLHRALSVAGSTAVATAPSTLWLNTCYPSPT